MVNSAPRLGLMAATSLLIAAGSACGAGKFFTPQGVDVNTPYERAFLSSYGGRETLVLQGKYRLSAPADSFGWVVPVPAVPEIATIEEDSITDLFLHVAAETRPNFIDLSFVLFIAVCLCISVPFWFCLAAYIVMRRNDHARAATWARRTRWTGIRVGVVILLLGMYMLGVDIIPPVLNMSAPRERASVTWRLSTAVMLRA